MSHPVPEPLLDEFAAFVSERLGLDFLPLRRNELVRGLRRIAHDLDFATPEACLRRLLGAMPSRRETEILARHLTVGETYFFREPAVFEALEQHVLPPLIAARREAGRRLRIWSAGCCTGEEAYSLAILLARLIPDLAEWDVTILGTDVNPGFLARSRQGAYREWSFRGVADQVRRSAFHPHGDGSWSVLPHLRRQVRFAWLNLAEGRYPSEETGTAGQDLVLCRNVLMYFGSDAAQEVAGRLCEAVSDGGWLVVGSTETSHTLFGGLRTVSFPGAILYRRDSRAGSEAEPVWAGAGVAHWVEPWESGPPPPPAEAARPRPMGPETVTADTADSRREAAAAASARGAHEEAIALLSGADPQDAADLALLARACADLGRLEDACRWCEAAVAADRLDPALRFLLATVLDEQGRPDEAGAALRQALYLDPEFILAHFALGNLERRRDRRREAARHYANAVRLLRACPAHVPLPHGDGLTAGRLLAILGVEVTA